MIFWSIAAFALAIVFASAAASAQTQLNPSDPFDFQVKPIQLLTPDFQDGDYCGNPDDPPTLNPNIALQSNSGFLNVRWHAKDPGGIERTIGVDCWLNCPANATDLLTDISVCNGYQRCSFLGPTGDHACSIQQPVYNYSVDNEVECRFYDPVLPAQGLVVEERVFRTVDYELKSPAVTVTVGSTFSLPVEVRSFGILESSFVNNVTPLQNPNLVFVQNGYANTGEIQCGNVKSTIAQVNILSSSRIPFSVLSHSSDDPTVCSSDAQCNYLDSGAFDAQCVSGVCWQRYDIDIDAGLASLPDYNIFGFMLIVISSSVIVFLGRRPV